MKKKKSQPPDDNTFYDRAYWLSRDELACAEWIEALEAIDARDDTAPLLALLKTVVPSSFFPHLLDLFERKRLTNRNSRNQPTPTYDRSRAEVRLELAAAEVRNWMRQNPGMTVKKAIDDVVVEPEFSCNPSTLEDYMSGKYGSTRRMKERRRRALIKRP